MVYINKSIGYFVSISVSSAYIVWKRKTDKVYLNQVGIVLDDTELVYWSILSLIIFLYFKGNQISTDQDLYKLLVLPFMLQTRFIKAILGHL